jgi:hypothetical protein
VTEGAGRTWHGILILLRTPGPRGPVPWTVSELARGTGAHPTTITDQLHRHAGDEVERAGTAPVPGARGRSSQAALWRARTVTP